MKWTAKVEYVDRETGEMLTKRHIQLGHYITVKQHRTIENINDYAKRINIKYECERNPQQQLEF